MMKFCILSPLPSGNYSEDGSDAAPAQFERWFMLAKESSSSRIDRDLGLPEFYGWIHKVGSSSEDAITAIGRARRFPGRLSVVSGAMPEMVRDFVADLEAEDAELCITLERYEDLGYQILGAMMTRAPYAIGAHILRCRIPDYAEFHEDDEYLTLCCAQLFVAMPFGARTSVMSWRSDTEKEGFQDFLHQRGFRSEAHIREALFTVGVWYWMTELGKSFAEAVGYAGGRSESHARKLVSRVLGVEGPQELRSIPLEVVTTRAEEFMLLHPERTLPLPAIQLPPTLLSMRLRLAKEAQLLEGESGWLDNKLTDQLMTEWGPFVKKQVGHFFPKGGGRNDAFLRVFVTVARKWVARLVPPTDGRGLHLGMTKDEQRASLWNICQNVSHNQHRETRSANAPLTSIQEIGDDDRSHPRQPTDPLQELEAKETRAIVEAAISTMAPVKAAIALASFFERLSNDEIAERFGWDPRSVATVLSQARAVVAEALHRYRGT